jgi:hypothetical protein
MKIAACLLLASAAAWAQLPTRTASAGNPDPAPQSGGATAPIPAADAQALSELLNQAQAVAVKSDGDVARLRFDKWKADAGSKQQAQASAVSIRRNLTNAVPDLIQKIQAAPASINANFKLYRDLNALYDTFSALAESAGAFGPREQYDPLAADIARLDQLRHQIAERVELLAGTSDAELTRLRAKVAAATAAAAKPAVAPKKVVVDDAQPKPKKKSKASQSPPLNPSN